MVLFSKQSLSYLQNLSSLRSFDDLIIIHFSMTEPEEPLSMSEEEQKKVRTACISTLS